MRVTVVGTGHVGLVTCASLAALGHEVVGTDADVEKIARLQQGVSPFFEPGLDDILRDGIASGRLRFTPEVAEAVPNAEIIFISVGTPPTLDGDANLLAVENVAREVARHATREGILVEKSTVPAGTGDRVKQAIRYERGGHLLEIASNPEFLSEGSAVRDAMQPQRILVGAQSESAFEAMRRLYAPVVENGARLIETDIETAELAKYVCNAFLALKVSFINAVARVCERSGADVIDVAEVMGTDPRIGRSFLNAGLGFGGSCFPKDIRAFQRLVGRLGYEFPLLDEVVRINEESIEATLDKVRDGLWNIEGKRVSVLGLSYKPGTDDVRFSPAMALVKRLLSEGADVVAFDPYALSNAKAEAPEIEVATDPYDAAEGSHCLVICTEWDEFLSLDLGRIKRSMAYPIIVDGRNVLDPSAVASAGLSYYPTGRPAVNR